MMADQDPTKTVKISLSSLPRPKVSNVSVGTAPTLEEALITIVFAPPKQPAIKG